ncbi:Ribonuclease H domain - like 2 [Theobroma cacao]|nr:Ribonuclease H domain - like 2 [Theobroma cacao]
MKAKYCAGHIPRYIQPKLPDAQTWKRMQACCQVMEQYVRWRIEKGGGLLRDHTRTLVFAFSEKFGAKNSILAKLLALHRGLILCRDYGISRVWIEMDAMVVIQMLKKGHHGSHDSRYVLASINKLLTQFSYRISHIPREGNQAADLLANLGHDRQNLHVFVEAFGTLRGILRLDKLGSPYVRIKQM